MEKDTCFTESVNAEPALLSTFKDDHHWQELCEKTRYVLPAWDVPASVLNIRIWLNRLDVKESSYRETMQTSVEDLLKLNPTWPLRAFVGLLLEWKFCSVPYERAATSQNT